MPRDKNGRFITAKQAQQEQQEQQEKNSKSAQPAVQPVQSNSSITLNTDVGASGAIALKDVPRELGDVSPDTLIAQYGGDNALTVSQAAKRSTLLERTAANLEVAIGELTVQELAIKKATKEVDVAIAATNYGTKVLKLEDAENRQQYQAQANQLNASIRDSKVTVLKGRAQKWKANAAKASAVTEALDALAFHF